jgi:hypothetical protein
MLSLQDWQPLFSIIPKHLHSDFEPVCFWLGVHHLLQLQTSSSSFG